MIGFHAVVRVLLEDVPCGRDDVLDHAGVDRCPVGGDLDRSGARVERAGEERSCSAGITAFENENVDDLAVLVDRAVEVRPAAGDLDVGLLDEPALTGAVALARPDLG